MRAASHAATRVLVFEDSVYRAVEGQVSTDRAFLHYVTMLTERGVRLRLLGRLEEGGSPSYYRIPPAVQVVGLPSYVNLVHRSAPSALLRSVRRAWRALDDVDVAWLMGPHPLACVVAILAVCRRVPVVLGVRQDLPQYARQRHPERQWAHAAADLLEGCWRLAARRSSVVAVGPQLSRHYAAAKRLLPLDICLVPESAATPAGALASDDGSLRVLSVGRLEQEKNPTLLADVLALLRQQDDRWRLVVCGEGSLEPALRARLAELQISEYADLLGYVPVDQGLLGLYRSSDVFLHVSWTEGLPQVLLEAWAAELPVVATGVGGVPEAAEGAALLVPPGDAGAAAAAVQRMQSDEGLRHRLVGQGLARVKSQGRDGGLRQLADFLRVASGA